MRSPLQLPLVVLLGGMASGAARLEATVVTRVTEQQLAKDAELILQGRVTRVDYRLSSARTVGEVQLPHTFVTFRIEQILKGGVSNSAGTITLRFLGGPDPQRRFLTVEECPLFDVGDRGILFVRRNQRHVCPVVGWSQGRFRVIGPNELYDDGGREVWVTSTLGLLHGKRHTLPEVDTHRRTPSVFTRVRHDADGSEEPPLPPTPIPGTRLTAGGFRDFVARLVAALHTPAELASLPPVHSADPSVPFFFHQPRAVPSEPEAATAPGDQRPTAGSGGR